MSGTKEEAIERYNSPEIPRKPWEHEVCAVIVDGRPTPLAVKLGLLERKVDAITSDGEPLARRLQRLMEGMADDYDELRREVNELGTALETPAPGEVEREEWEVACDEIGMGGIFDEFHSAPDAIRQLGYYILDADKALGGPSEGDSLYGRITALTAELKEARGLLVRWLGSWGRPPTKKADENSLVGQTRALLTRTKPEAKHVTEIPPDLMALAARVAERRADDMDLTLAEIEKWAEKIAGDVVPKPKEAGGLVEESCAAFHEGYGPDRGELRLRSTEAGVRATIAATADALADSYQGDLNEDERNGFNLAWKWLRSQLGNSK